jgi:biotin carboxyl carrier protein
MDQPRRDTGRPPQPRPAPRPRVRSDAPRPGPLPDTGIVLGGPRRRSRSARAKRDDWILPLIGVIALVVGAGLMASWSSYKPPPPPARAAVTASSPVKITAPKITAGPTPFFATYGVLKLRLPVPVEAVTTVSFHQATFNHALPMASLAPDMSLANAKLIASQRRAVASGAATSAPAAAAAAAAAESSNVPWDTWRGSVIRLYRSGRTGKPDTAVDVGAAPGTAVIAPVDGTVVLVRAYKLYSKYDDYEVHISPSAASDVDVVLIHISDVLVQPGQHVTGGVTRLASVRLLSKLTDLQLRDYAADGGDHTHLQVNRLPASGMLWISTPAGVKAVPFASASQASTLPTGAAPGNE